MASVMHLCCVVGARPNFMKMAPILQALHGEPEVERYLVHTGQHYDEAMSRVFFEELGLPHPDHDLGVGSDTHARQTAQIMQALDALFDARATDLVLVVGDVNSTLAAALVAAKRGIAVAHVEAGLRSRDRTMPEELNRIVVDSISDILFATSADAVSNLLAEGRPESAIHLVGNPMIDTLRRHLPTATRRGAPARFGVERGRFGLVTLHRPSNVDEPERLRAILASLEAVSTDLPILFPVHPRTMERIGGLRGAGVANVRLVDPQGYLDFLGLLDACRFVLTDSGGVQEESTALGVPCLTLRANTERPVTLSEGSNRLLGDDPRAIAPAVAATLRGPFRGATGPSLWDGHAGERIASILAAQARLTAPENVDNLID